MFTIEDIDARLRATPFEALRIVTSSGETYEVTQPELVVLGVRYMIVGLAAPEHPRVAKQFARVAIDHITALEDVSRPPAVAATAA